MKEYTPEMIDFLKDLKRLLKKHEASILLSSEYCYSEEMLNFSMPGVRNDIFYECGSVGPDCVCDTIYEEDCQCKDWE